MNQLMTMMDVLNMNKEVVLQALRSEFKDFEDALQSFTALHSRIIDAIITRNIKDYTRSEIGVLTPESFLKLVLSEQ